MALRLQFICICYPYISSTSQWTFIKDSLLGSTYKYDIICSNAGTCGDAVPECVCPDGKSFKPPQDLVADAVMAYNAQYD